MPGLAEALGVVIDEIAARLTRVLLRPGLSGGLILAGTVLGCLSKPDITDRQQGAFLRTYHKFALYC